MSEGGLVSLVSTEKNENKLVGLAEIAEMAQVKPPAVSNWRKRHADFPKPLVELRLGPIWSKTDVEIWLKNKGKIAI